MTDPLVVALLAFVTASALAAVSLERLLAAAVAFGAYSLGMASLWAVFRAPDVGLTEAAVGAGVTTSLVLAALVRTRAHEAEAYESRPPGERGSPADASSPAAAVAVLALVSLLLTTVPSLPAVGDPNAPGFQRVSPTYLAEAPDLGVKNVVTAILVVYRGFDTFGELVVVFAAGVAVLAVFRREVSA